MMNDEAREWIAKNGFQPVMVPYFGHYPPDFDRTKEYQFMRADWSEPSVFRLADSHPAFNVAGLYYREIKA